MKNILSYQPGTLFSGRDILDWAKYQVENHTSRYKFGEQVIKNYPDLQDCELYTIQTKQSTSGCHETRNKIMIQRFTR